MLDTIVFYWVMALLAICGTVVTLMLVLMMLDMAREIIGDLVYTIKNRVSK